MNKYLIHSWTDLTILCAILCKFLRPSWHVDKFWKQQLQCFKFSWKANVKLFFPYSAFDLEREREWRQREHNLKVQIAQLEATLKADLGEKGGILDRLSNEKGNLFIYCMGLS